MTASLQIVLVTCPADRAEGLARSLVEARVAACVNVLPGIVSVYRWQEAVQRDEEALLLVKAPSEGFEALRQAVLARHPYELPEIVAVNPDAVHPPYLDWILASCR
ncbi:divalent-cation tolerance protein CutA [Solimonas sp. SE-A11]|uniref:divalent-cation tolerance protein CutA n=1 Tax=Solimonas sp. SE-A11 TaxID=3054954 RepID=UPI00259CC2B5|nr:divalent-cation tolerance protein CutA [Solimonas sp. SE-A11]MDM4769768.1 divalent-cation tolerance protein CutA [Solimonas sp. SE-A11]